MLGGCDDKRECDVIGRLITLLKFVSFLSESQSNGTNSAVRGSAAKSKA